MALKLPNQAYTANDLLLQKLFLEVLIPELNWTVNIWVNL